MTIVRSLLAAQLALGLAMPAVAVPADFAGVWEVAGDGIAHPEDGSAVPLTPAGAIAVRAAQAAEARGDLSFDPVMHCLLHGTPRLMLAHMPMQLLVTGSRVVFLGQWNHSYRLVYLDRAHQPEIDPSFLGDSVGRWEGDVLTVDTVNMRAGLLDRSGVPAGEKLHVIERYSLADHGRRLDGRITVEDPDTFTHPWSFRVTFRRAPEERVSEQICADTDKSGRARSR